MIECVDFIGARAPKRVYSPTILQLMYILMKKHSRFTKMPTPLHAGFVMFVADSARKLEIGKAHARSRSAYPYSGNN